ncbi:Quinone-oxidoreductase homolog, chloroplastic [Linum grandiflorum]
MPEKLMHAVRYHRYGGGASALKHVEVAMPVPKKGEILVKVEAISLNPVDWKMQKGQLRPILPFRFPHIPGTDISGEVVEIGAGVKQFSPGDAVVGMVNHFVSFFSSLLKNNSHLF